MPRRRQTVANFELRSMTKGNCPCCFGRGVIGKYAPRSHLHPARKTGSRASSPWTWGRCTRDRLAHDTAYLWVTTVFPSARRRRLARTLLVRLVQCAQLGETGLRRSDLGALNLGPFIVRRSENLQRDLHGQELDGIASRPGFRIAVPGDQPRRLSDLPRRVFIKPHRVFLRADSLVIQSEISSNGGANQLG